MPQGTRVLIVEADEDLQILLSALLGDEGYEAEIVSSVLAVPEALERGRPALILVDMDQLENESEQAVRDLHAQSGQVPIVILGPRYEAATLAQSAGANASLAKPFEIDAMIDTVGRFARSRLS